MAGHARDPFLRFFKHTKRAENGPVVSGVRCLEWQLSCASNGYGHMYIGQSVTGSHRWAYETFVGAIPAGLFVCHKCDNKSCCEPSHLFLGTCADNMRDMHDKGRYTRQLGERASAAKLTNADVIEIFLSNEGKRALGRRYGISHSGVCRIQSGRIWAHVTTGLSRRWFESECAHGEVKP